MLLVSRSFLLSCSPGQKHNSGWVYNPTTNNRRKSRLGSSVSAKIAVQ
jgi:hypothetical protein